MAVDDEPRAVPRIFLSYRRDDSSAYAGRLYDYLVGRFGEDNVFIDIDSIEPGVDFADALEKTLTKCDTVLVVIGRSWLSTVGRDGKRRLESPNDFVRFEVARALASGTRRIIPVLVGGAQVPDAEELPESLAMLTRRQAFELSDHRWSFDVRVLSDKIERAALDRPEELPLSQPAQPTAGDEDMGPTSHVWDPDGVAAQGLTGVVAAFGPQALMDERTLANRLSDVLVGDELPKEQSLLLAASRRGVAGDLNEHIAQGIGVDAAVRMVAGKLEEKEPFGLPDCQWVAETFARALGYRDTNPDVDVDRSHPATSVLPVADPHPPAVDNAPEAPLVTEVAPTAASPALSPPTPKDDIREPASGVRVPVIGRQMANFRQNTDQFEDPAGLQKGNGRSRPTSTRKMVGIVGLVIVLVAVLVVVLLPSSKPSKATPPPTTQLSAASMVSQVHPDQLSLNLAREAFGQTDVPSDVSVSSPTLLNFHIQGMLAPVEVAMTGPATQIEVDYYIFTDAGDASHYDDTYLPHPSGYVEKSNFTTSGISDQTRCQRSYSAQLSEWASGCFALSNYVVTFVLILNTLNEATADTGLASTLLSAGVDHLMKVAGSSSRSSLGPPPGSLAPSALYSKLLSTPASAGVVVYSLRPATVTAVASSSSINGLVDNSYVDESIAGPDTYNDSADFLDFYVFDNEHDASSWYGQTGVIPADSTHVSNFDASGFSQTANCGTYSSVTVTGKTLGISWCSILDGDVVVTAQTELQSSTGYGNEQLAVILAWVGVMDIDLIDGA